MDYSICIVKMKEFSVLLLKTQFNNDMLLKISMYKKPPRYFMLMLMLMLMFLLMLMRISVLK